MRRWLKVILLLLFSGATLSGMPAPNSETNDPWIRGTYTGKSPRAVSVSALEAWQRANDLAENTPDTFVLVGEGESMNPLYQPGTILVLQRKPYQTLERGQTALYRTRANRAVAHVLVAKARDGWRAIGLNNRLHDMEPVVESNLVGIVIAAFTPHAGRAQIRVASRD